jgi:hypothetical protein
MGFRRQVCYDRFGISVLIPVTLLSALFAPLVFLGSFWMALAGACLWGLGMGYMSPLFLQRLRTWLHLNGIFRTFGAGWRGKLDMFDTLKK